MLLLFPIGQLDVKSGANVRYFTTNPGQYGKPNKIVMSVKGIVAIYEVFDWTKIDSKLKGEGHVWYRVNPTNGYWIYGMTNFIYRKLK